VVPVGGTEWMVLPGEGGHTNPPLAGLPYEFALWPRLFADLEQPVAEDILSGPGILRTYRAWPRRAAKLASMTARRRCARRPLDGRDATAAAAFELFLTWLGRMAGDLALIAQASGGVYIAGGIVPKYLAMLKSGPFRPLSRPRAGWPASPARSRHSSS
jgi:glucokinase